MTGSITRECDGLHSQREQFALLCARLIVVEILMARTEIHDALANPRSCLAQDRYPEANTAMIDAERHYKSARSAITIGQSGSIPDRPFSFWPSRLQLKHFRG